MAELNPKLLDVVEFQAEEGELGFAGALSGTVVEVFGEPPEAVLIEVADTQGVPTDLITRPVDQIKPVWRPGTPPFEGSVGDARQSFERGLLLLQNGLIASARSDFEKAFEADPRLAGPLMNSANQLAEKGEFDSAIVVYELIRKLQPTYALAKENLAITSLNRGVQYARRGAIDKALDDFHTCLAIRPSPKVIQLAQHNLVAAYTRLGIQQTEIRRYREAVGNFMMALALNPSEITQENLALALVSFVTSKLESSRQSPPAAFFRRPMQMGLTLSECLNAYGATLASLGNIPDARRALAQALEADPKNDLARKNLEILSARGVPSEVREPMVGLQSLEPEAAQISVT